MAEDARHPSETFLRSIDVHQLLPQQEPFVTIGTLTGYDERCTTTETVISTDNIFVENGVFSAPGLVENIAQTCAARIGYVNKYILLKGIQLGFIGAIRNLKVSGLPRTGDTIETKVTVTEEMFCMTLADAVVTCNGQEIVTTEIKIAVREEQEEK